MANYYGNTSGSSGGAGGAGGAGGGFYEFNYAPQPQPQQQPTYNPQQWMPHQQQPQQPQQQQQTQEGAPQQPQEQQQQQMMQPQQQAAPFASFWNPAAAATMAAMAAQTFVAASSTTAGQQHTYNPNQPQQQYPVNQQQFNNAAVLDFASTAGQHFLQSGTARMVPGLEYAMMTLRSYFAVDNKYVVKKLKIVLLPFLQPSTAWRRQHKDVPPPNLSGASPIYDLPNVDENAPDLYIPTMSLITYVLLCALASGTSGKQKFSPEVIPEVTSWCCITQLLEVLAIRCGFYVMQAPVAFLDLWSYTGYKYLGLCINLFFSLLMGNLVLGLMGAVRVYYLCFLWTGSAMAFFMLKTMANNIPMQTASQGPKREVMVLCFALSQFLAMWLVSQTKFLDDSYQTASNPYAAGAAAGMMSGAAKSASRSAAAAAMDSAKEVVDALSGSEE